MSPSEPARIASSAVLAAVVLAPVVFWPGSADIFGLPKLAVIAVLVAVAGVALAVDRRAGRDAGSLPPFAVPAAVFLAAFALATITSRSRITSLIGATERHGGLLPTAVFVLAGVIVASVARARPRALRQLPTAVVAGGALLSAYLLAQVAGLDVVDWTDEVGGPVRYHAGSMGNSNFAGGYLGIALPCAVHLVVEHRRGRQVAAAFAGALCVAGLWITSSRGGLLAGLTGVLALGAWHHQRLAPTRRARVIAGIGIIVLLVAGIGVASRLTAVSAVVKDPVLRTDSAGARVRTWTAAAEMALDRPVLGHGPDTFGLLYPRYRTVDDARRLGLRITDKPHNVLLEHLAGGGVVLAAAYAFVFVWVGRRVLRSRRRSVDASVVAPLAAALVAYAAQAFVSIDVPPLALLGWVLLGALAAAVEDRPPGRGTTPARWFTTGVAVTAVALALAAVAGLVADVTAGAARRAVGDVALERYDRAIARNPMQMSYRLEAAFTAEALGAESEDGSSRRRRLDTALRLYDDVAERQPASLVAAVGRARTLTLLARGVDPARFPEANDAWRDALRLDPVDWEVFASYGLMLNSWANAAQGDPAFRREAETQLERAVDINPSSFHGWTNLTRIRLGLGDAEGAADAFRRAEALEPDHSDLPELRRQIDGEGRAS